MSQAKTKGTAAETAVIMYLRDHGFPDAERRALNGTQDRGDVAGVAGVCIEVKNQREFDLAQWLDEALREGRMAKAPVTVVWHKRRNKGSAGEWYVTMTGEQFTRLIHD
jgi:Holliday junction resolvase